MKKIILFFSIVLIAALGTISAQDYNSLQVNGGIILPRSSSNGFTLSVQYNYSLNDAVHFYVYSGYSYWDKFKVRYLEDYTSLQNTNHFETYSADEHSLVPVYVGGSINLHNNKIFTAFATVEGGFSHLSYNRYKIDKIVDSETGVVTTYKPDLSTGQKINENLWGIGLGFGLFHQIADDMNLVFTFKVNSSLNSSYYKFLSNHATYTAYNLGVNFKI